MPTQLISKAVGIDLGTTNSAVAVLDPSDTDIIIHRDPKMKRQTTPSCVWKDPKAGSIVVGHKAFRRIGTMPSPVRSAKRSMGDPIKLTLTDEEVTPEQASAYILAEMKRQIEEDVAGFSTEETHWLVDRAIVTVPAYFDSPQIEATREAAKLAGLEVVELLHEPTAAACYHCWRTGVRDGTFLVYDLGGGTFDVTVLRSTAGEFQVLGISGNNRLGGDDMDSALALLLQQRLVEEDYSLDLDVKNNPDDRLLWERIRFLAESVKKAMSTSGEFLLRDQSLQDKEGMPIVIETMFELPEVEECLRPIVDRTIPYCYEAVERATKKAEVTLADIDEIILAGGSTHVPVVRRIVQETLCDSPEAKGSRAKCTEPVHEKVDTVVALGAAIRAAASGGLAVYNPERTLRVAFRGLGATDRTKTRVGGKVETLDETIDLSGGRVRLVIADSEFEDQVDLSEVAAFAFRGVPLQPSADNLLTFEVYDGAGNLLTTAGRPVKQSEDAARSTGGVTGTAVLCKPLSLEVVHDGKPVRRILIKETTPLPAEQDFEFTHPGSTELVRLPLYQYKRKVKEILVPVDASLPKGTPVRLNLRVDEMAFITAKGTIGETEFEAAIEPPPPRELPADEEIGSLDRSFEESVQYLPAGKKSIAEARYKNAKQSFQAAMSQGNREQAIHDFEEMEELVSEMSRQEGTVEPPREFFDDLVAECFEINREVGREAADAGQPHDVGELQKGIETQRQQGEKAFGEGNQKRYSDSIMMLENIRNHLIGLYQKIKKPEDTRSESEKTMAQLQGAHAGAGKVADLAQAAGRPEVETEAKQIQKELEKLAQEAQKNPSAVRETAGRLWQRLEQLKNMIMRKPSEPDQGDLVEDHSVE